MMFKKLMPLIILGLFTIGALLMKKGMDNAVHMTKPKPASPQQAN